MTNMITGIFQGEPVQMTVKDGRIIEGDGSSFTTALRAAMRAKAPLRIPGVWEGEPSLRDPWALRALCGSLLERGTFQIAGDALPDITADDAPGSVY